MIIFWQHFFIVVVKASSSPYSPSSPHVSSFSTFFIRAHVCEKLLWCPYCPLCPRLSVHNFVFFCRGERLQFRQERSTIVPFAALKSRVIIVLAAHTESLFGSSTPLYAADHRLLITNLYHPIRQRSTIVPTDDKKD